MVTTELRTACCNAYYTDWDGILVCRKCEARNPNIEEVKVDSWGVCNEPGRVIEFGRPGVGKTNIEHDSKDEVMLIYVLDDGETWTLTEPTPVPVTAEQLARIEGGEKVYRVVPDWDEQQSDDAEDFFIQAGIAARERLKKTAMESAQEYIDSEE
mgnify:CR=1 FL=1